MSYILTLDQGTSSSRAVLFRRNGDVVAREQREITQHYPQPGWVEHDPMEIWSTQRDCAQAILRNNAIAAHEVAAIAITNQRETTVLWDRASGEPLGRAIVWQDRRTAMQCGALTQAGHAPTIVRKTGLVIDPYFSATKLAWLLDTVPQARQRAGRGELAFGTVDAWLIWNLTGGRSHVTDPSNAARTLLFDIHRGEWDDELLELFRIPRSLLPQVVPSSGVIARTAPDLLGAAVPIGGLAGDQQAAAFGQACFAPGMAKNTYGTGCFLLLNVGDAPTASQNRLLSTVGWRTSAGTEYMLEGSIFMGGATVQWLRDGLGLIRHAGEIEALARSVPDTGGATLVPAFTGLGAPHWDPHARGTLVGMTRGTGAAHIARAALESIAFQSADLLHAMEKDAGLSLRELRVDGGASRNDLLMQFQADLLGVPVLRPHSVETTAWGAAGLAGLAVGYWTSAAELESLWRTERCFEPAMSATQRDGLLGNWRRAVDSARHWSSGGVA